MGEVKVPAEVKLILGMIFKDKTILTKAEKLLFRRFGKIDFESPLIPFLYSNYYKGEMGKDLKRKFISFQKLINPESISQVKIFTNKIEKRLSLRGKRQINLDPGYISASKLVLASTKNYSHRLYLKRGIYGEVTLSYREKNFCPLPWTYPDYKTDKYLEIFGQIRKIYLKQL
jgi:hypothetical protein